MKTATRITGILLLFIFQSFWAVAQQSNDYQAYWIHEDQAKPSMAKKHENVDKELIAACKEFKVGDKGWSTLATTDYKYFYITPIEKMADLDTNPFADLAKKMGEEKMGKIFEKYEDCYDAHGDYILILDKKLSYQPGGINTTPAGQNYRENTRYHFSPENAKKANELAKKFHKLYTEKGSKQHYRLYRNGFGTMGNYFLVAVAAESPEAMERMSSENRKLLGQEGQALFAELEQLVSKVETIRGYMRPDLSYSPAVANN
ncbi:MAG: hypothetical protein CMC08_03570 [Flavobacteriaceae bacterium]|nr:hypothetical protein [Flavobacteriaceae bacterium]